MTYVIPAVAVVACLIWILLYRQIKNYLWIQSRYTDAEMLSKMLEDTAEKAVRIVEEEGIIKPDIEAKKRIDAAKNILNDVLRERGLDSTKFNTQGLVLAKRHETLHHTRVAGGNRDKRLGKTPKSGGNGGSPVPK